MPRSLQELLQALTELLRLGIRLAADLHRPRGSYEVISNRTTLHVLDSQGLKAIYEKKKRVRFLRDQVTSFYDYGWGEGDTFASHRVHPGRIVECRQIGARYRSLVVLPAPRNNDDVMMFEVRRLIRNGLTGKTSWLEAELHEETHQLDMCVNLPASRKVRSARLVRHREAAELPIVARLALKGKQQQLRARVIKPRIGDLYTLEWEW